MNKPKIAEDTINFCAKSAPEGKCENCRCTESECIESLYYVLHTHEDV